MIYPEQWIPSQALANIGNELYQIHPKAMSITRIREFEEPDYKNRKKMILQYSTKDGSRVIISRTDENRDSIYVVLNRIDRKYVLSESKLEAGHY